MEKSKRGDGKELEWRWKRARGEIEKSQRGDGKEQEGR